MSEITFKIEHTGKKCSKCNGEIIIRNARRWPHDLIIECQNCKKKYKLEVAGPEDSSNIIKSSNESKESS